MFFKGLCHTTAVLKPFCWINTINPSITSLLYDSWCFEIPLALKPTYINMHLNLDSLTCSDFCLDNGWDINRLYNLFGSHACEIISRLGHIDCFTTNMWVWAPKLLLIKLLLMSIIFWITTYMILLLGLVGRKFGLSKLCLRLNIFLWLLFNRKIATVKFLYSINLGPRRMYIFCNLDYETSEHLFNHCCNIQGLWNSISTLTSKHISFLEGFILGVWLIQSHFSTRIKALIALTA